MLWENFLKNDWMFFADTYGIILHVVSDASTQDGWGYVLLDEDFKVIDAASVKIPEWVRRFDHIYYFELYAAVTALQIARKKYPYRMNIHLGCDNTAAIGTLVRGYSANENAWRIANKILGKEFEGTAIDVIHVPSSVNVADALSHFAPWTEK